MPPPELPPTLPPDLPPDVARALITVASFVAGLLRQKEGASTAETAARYYDARTAPMGRRAFLRLARAGAFPTFRAGRKLLARRDDVHAWIESRKGRASPEPMGEVETPLPTTPEALHELLLARPVVGKRRSSKGGGT